MTAQSVEGRGNGIRVSNPAAFRLVSMVAPSPTTTTTWASGCRWRAAAARTYGAAKVVKVKVISPETWIKEPLPVRGS